MNQSHPKYLVPTHRCSNRSARLDERVELVYVRLHGYFIIVLFAAHLEQHVGLAGGRGWEEVEDGRRRVVTAFVHQVRSRKKEAKNRRRKEEGGRRRRKEEGGRRKK